jgi:hypothetical protein
MTETTSQRLFRELPPHVERDQKVLAWELSHVKEVVQDHHDRLAKAEAPQSQPKGYLQQLPAPLALIVLALAAIKDPVAVLKLISW